MSVPDLDFLMGWMGFAHAGGGRKDIPPALPLNQEADDR